MAKKLIQDIIVSSKKVPRQIIKPPDIFYDFSGEEKGHEAKKIKQKFKLPRFKFPRLKYKLIGAFLAIAVLVAAGAGILNKFSSVVVEITPRIEIAEVDAVLNARLEPKNGELPLEIMNLSREETGSGAATGVKDVKIQASGKIIIYNVYSSQPQSLVSGTRFLAPDGKIYRVNKPIVVAGAKIENGKIVASETETTVFADKPGGEYNIGLTDFIIPGFQEAEKREKIYARSKTEMTGGFVGRKKFIAEEDISSLRKSLRGKITDYFLKTGVNPKPEEFLLYAGAKKIIFSAEGGGQKNSPKAGDIGDILELKEGGTFYGFLVKKDDLGRALAKKYFSPERMEQMKILNPENFEFELKSFDASQMIFGIKGKARFVWGYDENNFKNELVAAKENPESVFTKYESVAKAKIIFKPSWWRRIPSDLSRIEIKTVID